MRYLSIDLEATGLEEHDLIIEFAAIPIDTDKKEVNEELSYHSLVKCPSFAELKPKLNPWVVTNNKELIQLAHNQGSELSQFKKSFENYIESVQVQEYFYHDKIVLFGKSVNAIDLPFMTRDLSWEFMRKHFSHRVNDLSSFVYNLIDAKIIPEKCISGGEMNQFLNMGEVAHTAMEDAKNTALAYFDLLDMVVAKELSSDA